MLLVELHLVGVLGHDGGRASVSFLGTDPIEVLRFGPDNDGLIRYATVGMSRSPMSDPLSTVVTDEGPRAELLLTVRGAQDDVFRTLAVVAASPTVEGLVLAPGAGIDLGQPLWDGCRFTALLVGEPGGHVPDLEVEGHDPVRFLPLLPMTANEAAWKRVHGAAALEERWLLQARDLRDPDRLPADLR
ncbi:MAG: Suppressor of fused domain protein [Frankiales bacterium]|nr:Suppressor of fused domain protein [Frankiales bacterium]